MLHHLYSAASFPFPPSTASSVHIPNSCSSHTLISSASSSSSTSSSSSSSSAQYNLPTTLTAAVATEQPKERTTLNGRWIFMKQSDADLEKRLQRHQLLPLLHLQQDLLEPRYI